MAKKFIKFPDIEQFRTIVKNVQRSAAFVGLDEDEQPVYDHTKPKPVINFTGTVKLHGTNAGIGFDGTEIWAQKRGGICTIEQDNAGFAFFVEARKEMFTEMGKNLLLITGGEQVAIYGEWCGGNIQKGVGITGLEKMFVIFDVKYIKDDKTYWMDQEVIGLLSANDLEVYNIYDFQTWNIDVDFARPEVAQAEFIKITEAVEAECPVALMFNVSNAVGEGVVWRAHYKGEVHRFKVKGQKHSSSNVKTLSSIDVERVASLREFSEYACTKNRMKQAMEAVFTSNGVEPSRKHTGDFLRWVVNDIVKEEMDTMVENKLEPKDVNKYISETARIWFFNELDKY